MVDLLPAELPGRRVAAEPRWSVTSIETAEGSHELSGVRVRPLAGGHLAIAEASTGTLWLGESARGPGSAWPGEATDLATSRG